MKLYYSKGACSIAARITLHEIGIDCEFESVNLKTKQTETGQDFLKINPKGSVPTLITDQNEILTENSAIQQYLADKFNATQLLPAVNNMKRYRVVEWLSFISSDLHKTCGNFFNPNLPTDVKDNIFHPIFKSKLDYVEQQLHHNKFLTGDHFSVADSYLFVILSWLPIFKMDMAKWPKLASYFMQLTKRDSVKRSLAEEGLPEAIGANAHS